MDSTQENKVFSDQLEATEGVVGAFIDSCRTVDCAMRSVQAHAFEIQTLARGQEIYSAGAMQNFTDRNVGSRILAMQGELLIAQAAVDGLQVQLDRCVPRECPCTCQWLGIDGGTTICACSGRSPRRRSRSPSPVDSDPATQSGLRREGAFSLASSEVGDYADMYHDGDVIDDDELENTRLAEITARVQAQMMLDLHRATVPLGGVTYGDYVCWNRAAGDFHRCVMRGDARSLELWHNCWHNAVAIRDQERDDWLKFGGEQRAEDAGIDVGEAWLQYRRDGGF